MKVLKIKEKLFLSINERYQDDFHDDMIKNGLFRAKTIAIFLIVVESLLIIGSFLVEKQNCFLNPRIYYIFMYLLMIIVMGGYLIVFHHFQTKKVFKYKLVARTCYHFTTFILLWNIFIALLDQLSYGQLLTYFTAIVGVSLVTLLEPLTILSIYILTHIVFIVLLPYFQKSNDVVLGSYINTSIVVIMSWIVQTLLYRNKVYDFNHKKILLEKNNELNELSQKLKLVNEELEILVQKDGLTGIYNRMMFEKLLNSAWKNSIENSHPISLIMVDIDYFKAFNDHYGHQAGDECIKKVSHALCDFTTESSKFVARYGGEEFAIVIDDVSKETTYAIAEQLRKNVENMSIPHAYSLVAEHLTISLGVYSTISPKEISIESFINKADNALYQAKAEGKNKIVLA